MAIKKTSIQYGLGLNFWRETAKADVNSAIKKRLELVKKMRLGGREMIWQGNGNADAGKPTLGNLTFQMWFKTKAEWQKVLKKMDADSRFEVCPARNPEHYKHYRDYTFVEKAKAGR